MMMYVQSKAVVPQMTAMRLRVHNRTRLVPCMTKHVPVQALGRKLHLAGFQIVKFGYKVNALLQGNNRFGYLYHGPFQ
jgi:hypothetical protein